MNNSEKVQPQTRKINYHPIYAEQWIPKEPGEEIQGTIFTVDQKQIGEKMVPFIEIIDEELGTIIQVLLGNAALDELLIQGVMEAGNFIALRYEGLSKTIKKAGNFMKLFSAYVEDKGGKCIYPLPKSSKIITKKQQWYEELAKCRIEPDPIDAAIGE